MDEDTCHICLDIVRYTKGELIKECCDAFICNVCWERLIENSINTCPICNIRINRDIDEEQIPINYLESAPISTEGVNSNRDLFRRVCILLKWILIGYILTIIIVVIINHNDIDNIGNDIIWLIKHPYFYPLSISYGYCLTSIFENIFCRSTNCPQWNPPNPG